MNKSIVIITCWFGAYPWYWTYFVKSCAYNPTIDFYIITDNMEPLKTIHTNIKIIYETLSELNSRASIILGFKVKIRYPYKLCDFKPAYGFLFPEIIKNYDFWGYADIDLVYGNIRNFMTDKVLNNHDVISSRHDYITGNFCLFRNISRINCLFMESKDYRTVFSSVKYFGFDECSFLFNELQNGASVFDYPETIQSMTYVVKKAVKMGKVKAFFDFIIIEGTPGEIKWDHGTIIYKNMFEVMFYHLIRFKSDCKKQTILNPMPSIFHFTTTDILANK